MAWSTILLVLQLKSTSVGNRPHARTVPGSAQAEERNGYPQEAGSRRGGGDFPDLAVRRRCPADRPAVAASNGFRTCRAGRHPEMAAGGGIQCSGRQGRPSLGGRRRASGRNHSRLHSIHPDQRGIRGRLHVPGHARHRTWIARHADRDGAHKASARLDDCRNLRARPDLHGFRRVPAGRARKCRIFARAGRVGPLAVDDRHFGDRVRRSDDAGDRLHRIRIHHHEVGGG